MPVRMASTLASWTWVMSRSLPLASCRASPITADLFNRAYAGRAIPLGLARPGLSVLRAMQMAALAAVVSYFWKDIRQIDLDDPEIGKPQMTIWTSSPPSWAVFDPNIQRNEKQSPPPQ
jgi:hypothetical protein